MSGGYPLPWLLLMSLVTGVREAPASYAVRDRRRVTVTASTSKKSAPHYV